MLSTAILPGAIGRGQRFTVDQSHDLVDASADGGKILSLLQQWHHGVLNDAVGGRIGQYAFQAIAVFDAQAVVVLGDDQQRTVIDLFSSEFPGLHNPNRILLDLLGLRACNQQHCDLCALAGLEIRELLLELGLLPGRQRTGQIGDPGFEFRYGLQRLRIGQVQGTAQNQRRKNRQQQAHDRRRVQRP